MADQCARVVSLTNWIAIEVNYVILEETATWFVTPYSLYKLVILKSPSNREACYSAVIFTSV